MRIVSLNPNPIVEFAYLNAGHGPGGFEEVRLPVPPTLIVRGHAYWPTPLVELVNGTQVLNVDARVVLLRRASR